MGIKSLAPMYNVDQKLIWSCMIFALNQQSTGWKVFRGESLRIWFQAAIKPTIHHYGWPSAALSLSSQILTPSKVFKSFQTNSQLFCKSQQNSTALLFNLWAASLRASKGLALLLASLISDAFGLINIRCWYQMLQGRGLGGTPKSKVQSKLRRFHSN